LGQVFYLVHVFGCFYISSLHVQKKPMPFGQFMLFNRTKLPIFSLIESWINSPSFSKLSLIEQGLLLHIFLHLPETSIPYEQSNPSLPDLFYMDISKETGDSHQTIIGTLEKLVKKGILTVRDGHDFRYFYTGFGQKGVDNA
jgi:hypothetical protein